MDPEAKGTGLKLNWPELQKDSAPSQLLLPAGRCLARQMKKNEEIIKRFTGVEEDTLSDLQKQSGSQSFISK